MRAAAVMVTLTVITAGCMDSRSVEHLAAQRLEAGDQRLIGYHPPFMHAPPVSVVGVECEPLGFPIRILEPSRNPATARRELAYASRFNNAMITHTGYTAAECERFGPDGEGYLGAAVSGNETSTLPTTESFEQIFGFPAR